MHRPQTYTSHIHSINYSPNQQVMFLRLKVEGFVFKEGQFVMMHLPFGDTIIKRSYSICTTYLEYMQHGIIGCIIKYVENGLASEYFFNQANIGDKIDIIGPLGHLTLPEETSDKHFILISTGSGLSPIYGIFQSLIESNNFTSITHLYGEKTQERLVPETNKILTYQGKSIINKLCLSREEINSPNHFHGYVGQALTKSVEEGELRIENGELPYCYLCGKPETVDQLSQQLLSYGIPKENIKSEKY